MEPPSYAGNTPGEMKPGWVLLFNRMGQLTPHSAASRDFLVIAPAISAEAIIVNETGALVASMSNIGRTREQAVADARKMSFAPRLHEALGDLLFDLLAIQHDITRMRGFNLSKSELESKLQALGERLQKVTAEPAELSAGVALNGEAAKQYDAMLSDERDKVRYAQVEAPNPDLVVRRNSVDVLEQERVEHSPPTISEQLSPRDTLIRQIEANSAAVGQFVDRTKERIPGTEPSLG